MTRRITAADRSDYLALAEEFYSSNAVLHPIPTAFFERAFDEALRSDTYLEAYLIECEEQTVGYALIIKTYSQEAGGILAWIDELYLRPAFRGRGLGRAFLTDYETQRDPSVKRTRLEVAPANESVCRLYRSMGFAPLDYLQMLKEH